MEIVAKYWLLSLAFLQLYFLAAVEAYTDYGTFLIDKKFCEIDSQRNSAVCSGINVEGLNYTQYKFYIDNRFRSVIFKDSFMPIMPTNVRCEECSTFAMINCSLEDLRVEDFRRWRYLRTINLSHNKLSSFPVDILPTTVYELDISYNQLSTLPADLFNASKVENLNLSHNRIGSIHNNTFKDVPRLDLSYNNLTNSSLQFLSHMKDLLKSLDLSGNCLGDIPLATFAGNANLTRLVLSQTCIKDIKFGTFPRQSLKELDLSNNQLSSLYYLKLYPVRFLERIFLENTYVSQYNIANIIKEFPIREIGLSSDRYECKVLIDWLRLTERNLTLRVKPENAVWNRTNINGVACFE